MDRLDPHRLQPRDGVERGHGDARARGAVLSAAGDDPRARGLAAARAGRDDEALALLADLPDDLVDVTATLTLAELHRRRADGAAERRALDLALRLAPDDLNALTRVARRRLDDAPHTALAAAARAVAFWPDHPRAHAAHAEVLQRLGRWPEALDALLRAVRAAPDDVPLRRRAANIAAGHRNPGLVVALTSPRRPAHAPDGGGVSDTRREGEAGAVDLPPAPDDPELAGLRAAALIELVADGAGSLDEARDAVLHALALTPGGALLAARRLIALGDVAAAEALVAAAPDGDERQATLATLALWRLDLDGAEAHAKVDHPAALVARGAALLLRGHAREAVPILEAAARAADAGPEAFPGQDTALVWLAEAYLAVGERGRARGVGQQALLATWSSSIAATLVREKAEWSRWRDPGQPLHAKAWARALTAARPWLDAPLPERVTAHEAIGLADAALARLGGNRSRWPTTLSEGRLVGARPPPWPRSLARATCLLVRSLPPEVVLERFHTLQAAWPQEPTSWTYEGELLLWLGRYQASEHLFHRAIEVERYTTWAWIGLGTARLLQGHPDEALRWFEQGVDEAGFEGPTLFAVRGEARWRVGDLDGARADLDAAVRHKPRRFSAWVLRALLHPDLAPPVARALRAHVPGLALDVEGPAPGDDLALCEAALQAMRGNRSSTLMTWFAPNGDGPRLAVPGRWMSA